MKTHVAPCVSFLAPFLLTTVVSSLSIPSLRITLQCRQELRQRDNPWTQQTRSMGVVGYQPSPPSCVFPLTRKVY